MNSSEDQLLRFRREFPILASSTYLVSNSLGAMPKRVESRLGEYAEKWATRGVRAWAEGWWEMPGTVGNIVAPLLGARDGEVIMVPTVTHGMSAVLSSLDYASNRDEIVMTALDFPSVRYAYEALGPRLGARIVVVPADEDGIGIDIERLLAAITTRTRLVAISHVLFRSAYIIDVQAVCAKAREVGALVALDAYHSIGVMPVDVHALGVDFMTGGVLKWLCGGPGGCFLYASPDACELVTPALSGWQAHQAPFAFSDTMSYARGSWRFLGGTPVIPALFAAMEGPTIVNEAGMQNIREKSVRQTEWIIKSADDRGWRVNAPRDSSRRGGTVAVDVPNAAEVARALIAQDIVIDYRPGAGIRIAPHFYTTDEELAACIEAIDEILRSGSWMNWSGISTTVT